MAANKSPAVDEFCAQLPPPQDPPVLSLLGGATIVALPDPTKGAAGNCELSLDLMNKLTAAVAPLAPLMLILDVVAQLVTCFQLATDAISNPFKIPDLLACLPDLVTKFNQLLGLVPAMPQGVVQIVSMVYSMLKLTRYHIQCVIDSLQSVQKQLEEVNAMVAQAQEESEGRISANLLALSECAKKNAQRQANNALAALAPVMRILCFARTLLAMVPGGRDLACKLSLEVPTSTDSLDATISTLEAINAVIDEVLGLIELLAKPFGGLITPTLQFKCPIDSLCEQTAEEEAAATPVEPPTPTIVAVTPTSGTLIAPIAANLLLSVTGTGFVPGSKLYLGATALDTTVADATYLMAWVPKELFANPIAYQLTVVNAAPSGGTVEVNNGYATPVPAQPFQGLPDAETGAQTSLSRTSNQVEYKVI